MAAVQGKRSNWEERRSKENEKKKLMTYRCTKEQQQHTKQKNKKKFLKLGRAENAG